MNVREGTSAPTASAGLENMIAYSLVDSGWAIDATALATSKIGESLVSVQQTTSADTMTYASGKSSVKALAAIGAKITTCATASVQTLKGGATTAHATTDSSATIKTNAARDTNAPISAAIGTKNPNSATIRVRMLVLKDGETTEPARSISSATTKATAAQTTNAKYWEATGKRKPTSVTIAVPLLHLNLGDDQSTVRRDFSVTITDTAGQITSVLGLAAIGSRNIITATAAVRESGATLAPAPRISSARTRNAAERMNARRCGGHRTTWWTRRV